MKFRPGLAPGWVFASAPDYLNPCNMNIETRRRVRVTEGADYRSSFQKRGKQRPGGDRINVVMEFGNFGYADEITGAGRGIKRTNWEADIPRRRGHLNAPGVVPNFVQTGGGSPVGIGVRRGNLFLEPFRNPPRHGVVRSHPGSFDGAGHAGRIMDLVSSDAPWLRPFDLGVAPAGSACIAGWSDAGVGRGIPGPPFGRAWAARTPCFRTCHHPKNGSGSEDPSNPEVEPKAWPMLWAACPHAAAGMPQAGHLWGGVAAASCRGCMLGKRPEAASTFTWPSWNVAAASGRWT